MNEVVGNTADNTMHTRTREKNPRLFMKGLLEIWAGFVKKLIASGYNPGCCLFLHEES
jgi:hypothetical protein